MLRGLKQLSALRRLAWGTGLALLLAMLAGGSLWMGLSRAQDDGEQLALRLLPAMKTVLNVMADVRESRLLETQWLAARDDEGRRRLDARLDQQRQAVDERLREYTPLDALDGQHRVQVGQALLSYWVAQNQVVAAARRAQEGTGSAETSLPLTQGASRQAYDALSTAVDGWRLHTEQLAERQAQHAHGGSATWWRLGAIGLLAAALGAALVTVRTVNRAVREPLAQATRALRTIAHGSVDYRLKVSSLDEFGRLLIAIDDLREPLALAFIEDEPGSILEVTPARNLRADVAATEGATGDRSAWATHAAAA